MSYAFNTVHDMRTYLAYLAKKKQVVAFAEDEVSEDDRKSDQSGDRENMNRPQAPRHEGDNREEKKEREDDSEPMENDSRE